MKILKVHNLNKRKIKDIQQLVNECLKKDGLERALDLSNGQTFFQELAGFYLLYEDNMLLSVLTIFQPVQREAELSAYTQPEYRKKGYFKQLLQCALEEIRKVPIEIVTIVVEAGSNHGKQAVKSCGGEYVNSEYLLALENNIDIKEDKKRSFSIKTLEVANIKEAVEINIETLHAVPEEAQWMMNEILDSDTMDCFCGMVESTMVGICCVSYGNSNAFIYGVGVRNQYQGKGYGRMLLSKSICKIRKKGFDKIQLHVGSDSKKGLCLYESIGFHVETQYDYYKLKLS